MSLQVGPIPELLRALGFVWREPGYWSLKRGGLELALEPQVLNAGAYKLQLYELGGGWIDGELLVDVKPRPHYDGEPG